MRQNIIILFLAITTLVSFASAQSKKSAYVDFEYESSRPGVTLSNGAKLLGGGLIGKIDADPVYGISQLEKGKTKMLWLESSTGKNLKGVTGWRVLDALSFPTMRKTDYLFFYGDPGIFCRRRGTEVVNLVGVGRIMRRQGVFKPSRLWVANLETKKFESISIAGVECVYSEP